MGGFFSDPLRSVKATYKNVEDDPLKYAAPLAFGPGIGFTAIGVGESGGIDGGAAADSMTKGAEQAAALEQESREFQKELFGKQIERQTPFLEEGETALPQLVAALRNQPAADNLPSERIQGDLITEFLGGNAPSFVIGDAMANLSAVESEQGKNRLSNLVNFALGGVGKDAQSRAALGQTTGGSLMREGSIDANALMQQAISRQNMQNQLIGTLSGLPALIAASNRGGQPQGGGFSLGYQPTAPVGIPMNMNVGGYA